jgi:hypothetical protein
MERSYIFFIGIFAMLAGISLWSHNAERAVTAPMQLAQKVQERSPASSAQPLEIEAIESSAP